MWGEDPSPAVTIRGSWGWGCWTCYMLHPKYGCNMLRDPILSKLIYTSSRSLRLFSHGSACKKVLSLMCSFLSQALCIDLQTLTESNIDVCVCVPSIGPVHQLFKYQNLIKYRIESNYFMYFFIFYSFFPSQYVR